MDQLNAMGVEDHEIIISTNVPVTRSGVPRAGLSEPDDPGVAVYFPRAGRIKAIPCDEWKTVRENMQALAKTLEAMRGLERWGASNILDAAFAGFDALPAPAEDSGDPHWSEILGTHALSSPDEVRSAYMTARSEAHPDRKHGSPERFRAVEDAYAQFKAQRNIE